MQIIGCDYLHLFELQFPSNSHMNLQLKKDEKKQTETPVKKETKCTQRYIKVDLELIADIFISVETKPKKKKIR